MLDEGLREETTIGACRSATAMTPVPPATPARETSSDGHCRTAAKVCPAYPTTSTSLPPKLSAMRSNCSTEGWHSTPTRCSRRHGRTARPQERALWQGLAQLAVGITHVQRGNVTGAIALLERAAGKLAAIRSAPHHIDADGLAKHTETLVEELRAGAAIAPPRLRPSLVISAAGRRAT